MPTWLDDNEPTNDFLADPEDQRKPWVLPPHPLGAGDQPTIREIIAQSQPRLPVSPETQTGGSPALANARASQPLPPPDELRQGVDRVTAARAHTTNVESRMPKPREPKWWVRALAGAVGGAAGYVNAAGRTRVNPTAAIEGIYGVPGQQRKVEAWQGELAQAQGGEQAAQANLSGLEKARQLESTEKTAEATREHLKGQARNQNVQADTMEEEGKRDPLIKLPDGTVIDRATQKVIHQGQTKSYNLQKVTVKRPGSQNVEEAYADPRNPGRLISLTGEELPAGTVSVSASAEAAKIRQDSYGEFGNYYRSALGKGVPEADARRVAGEMVFKKYGVTLGAQEQNVAIKGELSGIGGGVQTPQIPQSPPAQSPQSAPANTAKPIPGPPSAGKPLPLEFTDKETGYINQFLGQLTGVLPVGRGGAAGQIGVKRGMELIAKRAGVDPMTLNAAFVQDKAVAKQLAETIQRTGAIQRLNNTLELHGKILTDTAKNIPQTDAPFLNTPWQTLLRGAVGSPELKRYLIAINAVQREYAYLTAGGAQSKAMLPVSVTNTMDQLFQKNSTLAEIIAGVEQVKTEAHAETAAMNKTQQDLIHTLQTGISGQAVRPQQPPNNAQQQQPQSKPLVQHSPSSGQYRYSLDGGKTWLPGQPPQ